MAGGLVEVHVDAHHELDVVEGRVESLAVRSGQHRVAGERDERPDLALAGLEDLLRQCRHRVLAHHLGMLADPRMATTDREATTGAGRAVRRRPACDGRREHHPTRPVEVAAQDVDGVDEPRRGRTELARRGTDASVHGGGGCRCDLAGHPADRRRLDAGRHRHPIGRERCDRDDELVESRQVPIDVLARIGEPVGDEHVGDRREQQGVGARADRHPFVGLLGGLRTARIDHHDLAAARPDRLDAAGEVRGGAHAAVRGVRVGPEQHEMIGAVEVGNRHGQWRTEHVAGRDLAGHLIDGRRAEPVAGADPGEQRPHVQHRRQAVGRRVADVDRDRLATVPGDRRAEALIDRRPRLVPRRLDVAAVAPDQRPAETIGVVVQLLERRTLRADEAVREHVIAVAPDPLHRFGPVLTGAHGDLQAAPRLAQRAGPVGGAGVALSGGHASIVARSRARRRPDMP